MVTFCSLQKLYGELVAHAYFMMLVKAHFLTKLFLYQTDDDKVLVVVSHLALHTKTNPHQY